MASLRDAGWTCLDATKHRLEVLAVGSVAADPDDLGDVAVEEDVTGDRVRIRVTNEHELRPPTGPAEVH
jgi:hypothetical protein